MLGIGVRQQVGIQPPWEGIRSRTDLELSDSVRFGVSPDAVWIEGLPPHRPGAPPGQMLSLDERAGDNRPDTLERLTEKTGAGDW
jgi:hypothetical protein